MDDGLALLVAADVRVEDKFDSIRDNNFNSFIVR